VNVNHKIIFTLLLYCTVALGSSTFDKAQKAFLGGDYEAALALYDKVEATDTNRGVLAYNKGNCQYELGDYDKAVALYLSVQGSGAKASLLKKANYNLGNCYYYQSQVIEKEDLRKALEKVNEAVKVYRKSLTGIVGDDKQAKENIALARHKTKAYIATIKYIEALQKEIEERRKALIAKLEKEFESQVGIVKNVYGIDNEIQAEAKELTEGPTVNDYSQFENQLLNFVPSQQLLNEAIVVSKNDAVVLETLQEKLTPPPPMPTVGNPGVGGEPQMTQQQAPKASSELDAASKEQTNFVGALNLKNSATASADGTQVVHHIKTALDILIGEQKKNDQENQEQQDQEGQQDNQENQEGQEGPEGEQEEQDPEQSQAGEEGEENEEEQSQTGKEQEEQQDEDEEEPAEAIEAEKVPDETAKAILEKERERKEKRLKIRMRQRGKVEKDW